MNTPLHSILHLLRDAGIIRRERAIYTLRQVDLPSDEALEDLLQVYRDRGQSDKERLSEMMQYSETVRCRTQVIRAYFGDEQGEPCGRCDPAPAPAPDERRTHVVHKRFGAGRVKDLYNGVALVHFTREGDKKVKLEFLALQSRAS